MGSLQPTSGGDRELFQEQIHNSGLDATMRVVNRKLCRTDDEFREGADSW